MPRQRSRKTNGSRKNEPRPATKFEAEAEPESGNSDSGNGMSDIDEEEAELTRLLLGSAAEFKTPVGIDLNDDENSDHAFGEAEDGEADAGIEDLADDDVRNLISLRMVQRANKTTVVFYGLRSWSK